MWQSRSETGLWNCSVDDAVRDFGFKVNYPLERGVEEIVKAYIAEKKHEK